jgi:hypothetical protein
VPSHRTPSNARVGDSRRADGGHAVRSPGKGPAVRRRDNDNDLQPPGPALRPSSNTPVAGEPQQVILDRR